MLIAVIWTVVSGCSLRKNENITLIERYGISYNSKREKIGIPLIEDSWIAHQGDSSGVTWMNKSHRLLTKEAHHFAKDIVFRQGHLISEEDSFNKFLNDSVDQRVSYVYTFKTKRWTCEVSTHYYRSYPPSESENISIHSADSILKQWGLRRISRP
jgi:hypothetical protein